MSIHVYGSLIEWELPRYCTPFCPASADFASYRRKMIVIVCVCGPMAQVATKEGCLMKQTSSFQRWRRRYFKLKGRTLYYAKDTKVSPNNRCPINQPPPPKKEKNHDPEASSIIRLSRPVNEVMYCFFYCLFFGLTWSTTTTWEATNEKIEWHLYLRRSLVFIQFYLVLPVWPLISLCSAYSFLLILPNMPQKFPQEFPKKFLTEIYWIAFHFCVPLTSNFHTRRSSCWRNVSVGRADLWV